MPISDDTKQRISIFTAGIQQAFKILMACLLAVFVPQSCRGVDGSVHLCSEQENFRDLTRFNVFVLIYNFITLGSFIYFFVIEFIREDRLVKYFDIDAHKGDYHIHTVIQGYPKIQHTLETYNRLYYKSTVALLFFLITNFVFSAILVLHFFYLDFRTITTLLTNTLLVVDKLSVAYGVAKQSYVEKLPVSFYQKKHVTLNIIDKDYEGKELVKPDDVHIVEEVQLEQVKEPMTDILSTKGDMLFGVLTHLVHQPMNAEKANNIMQSVIQEVTQEVNQTVTSVIQEVNTKMNETEQILNEVTQEVNKTIVETEQEINESVNEVTQEINQTVTDIEQTVGAVTHEITNTVHEEVISPTMQEMNTVNQTMKEIIALTNELNELQQELNETVTQEEKKNQ
jgi:gas vesicle protein